MKIAALIASFACVFSAFVADAAPQKPNIVFILADDLGIGELGCYGQKQIATPNIDKLAKEGMRFTQCYSGSHVCAPSRSALMTGMHTGHTPIRSNGGDKGLQKEDVTVAEVLKQAGYKAGGFGKWGLGTEGTEGSPTRQGFDDFFGYLHQVHAHFFFPYYLWKNETKFFLPENEGKKHVRYSQDEIHKQALEFIRKNKGNPFFCYLPYTLPHVELAAPESAVKPYLGKFPETPFKDPRPGYLGSDTPLATFAGMVSYLDKHVGEVVALLKELGLEENTLVLFASDNGPQGGDWKMMADYFDGNGVFRGYKGEFYEGGIRVPLIARWPGKIKASTTSDHPCAFWDFLPTAAEVAGVSTPKNIDGISFLPTLLGKKQKEHEYLYWEMPHGKTRTFALRLGDWKAIQPREKGPIELYNLASDVSETKDVSAQHPEIMEKVKTILANVRTEERKFPAPETKVGINDYVR